MRSSPHTMASPSGLLATASAQRANVLIGRVAKQRTTRPSKCRSKRIAGRPPSQLGGPCDACRAALIIAACPCSPTCGIDFFRGLIDSRAQLYNNAARRKSMKRLALGLFASAAALLLGGAATYWNTIQGGGP